MKRTRQNGIDAHSVIEAIYAGTTDPQAWHSAISSIARIVGGESAAIMGVNPRLQSTFRSETFNVDRAIIDAYTGQWFDREIRLPPALSLPPAEPFFDQKLLPVRTFRSSEIYNDFLKKIERPWFLCCWLHKSDEKLSSISIHGTTSRGPFELRDAERLGVLIPHLQRALSIRDRLDDAQIRLDVLGSAVDQLPFGVIVLDARRRILECNAIAHTLMSGNSEISRHGDGTLRLSGTAGPQFERWIRGGNPPSDNPDGLLHAFGPKGAALSIMAMPLPRERPSWSSRDASWMLLVFDPSRGLRSNVESLSRDLNISMREAQLATLLAQGLELSIIAARMRISVHTARTHLKSIFAKTGCGSQNELIRRILLGPAGALRPP
jgi:DNA-binding CsgD family transcriptional regulator